MIEPTETEPKERLDAFVEVMKTIAREAAESPELLKEAPHTRPVRRLDEVKAAKEPIVKHAFGDRPAWERRRRTMPIFQELIDALERAHRRGARARPGAPRASCSRTSSRSTAPPGELDREAFLEAASGPYEIDDWAYEEIDPGDLRRHRRARLPLPADGPPGRARPLAPHARDGHLGAPRGPLADRAPARHARRLAGGRRTRALDVVQPVGVRSSSRRPRSCWSRAYRVCDGLTDSSGYRPSSANRGKSGSCPQDPST